MLEPIETINSSIRSAHQVVSSGDSGLRIGILIDQNVSIFSVRLSLNDAFNNASFQEISARCNQEDFQHKLKSIDLLVLPGVSNETCSYFKPLINHRDTLYDAIYTDGLCLFAICAGKYILYDRLIYRGSDGSIKEENGLGFKKGTTTGPVDRDHAPHQPTQSRFDQTRTIAVTYTTLSGHTFETNLCYGDGPAATPCPDEAIEILGQYTHVNGMPIAISSKALGKGLITSTGVLPEIALNHMILNKEHAHLYPSIQLLRSEMAPHENGRKMVMDDIVNRFDKHIKARKLSL